MIYLDNAATTYPKPPSVLAAFNRAAKEAFGNAGRASHAPARAAAELAFECRSAIADAFSGECERVVFASNATHALNLAIKAITKDDCHLLLSDIEHNATLRPVHALRARGVSYSLFQSYAENGRDTEAILASLEKRLTPHTKGVIVNHRSNCLPLEMPLKAIGDFCHRHRLFFIVDASQSAGACEIDLEDCHITALCAPSHKGLYGMRGAGFALFGKTADERALSPLLEGGSGSDSQSLTMPELLPERLEAGTLPVEILASLSAGLAFVKSETAEEIAKKEAYLSAYLKDRLLSLPHIRVYFPKRKPLGTVLFNVIGKNASEIAEQLDAMGICLRDGLHCAPLAHRHTNTEAIGAVRASFGYFNREVDADALVYALKELRVRAKG